MKITIIGGGSYLWSFGFSRQIIDSDKLTDVSLTLMDIDRSAVELIGKAVELYNQQNGSPVTVETSTDLTSSLADADYVLVAVATGGLDAMGHDLKIPEEYGILHTVGDTVGPGGWSRAVRDIPVFHEIAEKMKSVCPHAWLINFSNPLSVLTRVPQRCFGIKTLGMCPGVETQARSMAKLVGIEKSVPVEYITTGIDHGSYFTKINAGGIDVLEALKDKGYYRSDDKLPGEVTNDDPTGLRVKNRAVFAIWREVGYLPGIPDRHMVENFSWFLTNGKTRDSLPFNIQRTFIKSRYDRKNQRRASYEEFVNTNGQSDLGRQGHGNDPVVSVMESLSGTRTFVMGANYANVGQIPEMPLGAVVETRCRFDGTGVNPLCSPMPTALQHYVLPHVLRQEAIIDIALSGTFDELVSLVQSDPMCQKLELGQCREMMQEMLTANRDFIKNPRLLEFSAR